MVSKLTGGVPSPTEPSTAAFPDMPLADMSTHQPLSARGSPALEAENSDLTESVKETLTPALYTELPVLNLASASVDNLAENGFPPKHLTVYT